MLFTNENNLMNVFSRYGFEYPRSGIRIQEGWMFIFEELLYTLQHNRYEVRFDQVKQKFGELRIYYGCPTLIQSLVRKQIEQAIQRCFITCENCGMPGIKRNLRGWMCVMCNECFNIKYKRKNYETDY